MKTVMGVLGPIQEKDLGFTLPHEHLFTDLSCYWSGEYIEKLSPFITDDEESLKKRDEVIRNPWDYRDNCVLDDVDGAIHEAKAFYEYGGKTIVDVSPYEGMGRNPVGLLTVAEKTSVNVIMSTGRYSEPSMSKGEREMDVDQIEKIFLGEFENGVMENSEIIPGLLKVGFVSGIDKISEIRSLRAAGRAQDKIGCALSVHPHIWEPDSHLILDILEEEGCDLRKVILCHQDYLGGQSEYLDSLAKRGAYIEFDTFGCGFINDRMWQQSELEKIGFLEQQVELGNEEHILISGDMCLKIMLSFWGGIGLVNIPKFLIPSMKLCGISDELIQTITIDNPRRVFCH